MEDDNKAVKNKEIVQSMPGIVMLPQNVFLQGWPPGGSMP